MDSSVSGNTCVLNLEICCLAVKVTLPQKNYMFSVFLLKIIAFLCLKVIEYR